MSERVFPLTSRIYFAKDSLKKALPFLSTLGNRFVLITEPVLRTDTHAYQVRDTLRKAGLDTVLYDVAIPSSGKLPVETVRFINSSYADAVIGFGGMRTISIARWAALAAAEQSSTAAALKIMPFVALPSTYRNPFLFSSVWFLSFPRSGTGVFEISGNETSAVIMDPRWFSTLPPRYSGTTVVASILDAVEGLFSKNLIPLNEAFLSQSIQILSGCLDNLLRHPEDERYRETAGSGGILSSMGLASISPGPVNVLSLVLDARFGVPKAWSATVLLPYLLEYMAEEHPDNCASVSRLLGKTPERKSVQEIARYSSTLARDMIGLIDMPFRFTSFNLTDADLEEATKETFSILHESGYSSYLREHELRTILQQAV